MPVASDLYYYYYQSGELESLPVVFIHGAGGNHLYWPVEVRRMPGFRIFAPDLPGHGKSGGRGQQSIESYTHSLRTWLEGLGIHRAAFAGHSMGSAIAMEMALQHADTVLALCLLGAGARLRVHPDLLASSASETTFYSAVDRLVLNSYDASADPRLIELAVGRMAEVRPSVLHGDLLACDAFDVTNQVQRIRKPVLVICGAEDKMTPLRYSQFLVDHLPSARLEIIQNAGHMVMQEQPNKVAELLRDFLAGIPYLSG